jgi:hypothetical protein
MERNRKPLTKESIEKSKKFNREHPEEVNRSNETGFKPNNQAS